MQNSELSKTQLSENQEILVEVAYANLSLPSFSNAPIYPINTKTFTLPTPHLLKCTSSSLHFTTHSFSQTLLKTKEERGKKGCPQHLPSTLFKVQHAHTHVGLWHSKIQKVPDLGIHSHFANSPDRIPQIQLRTTSQPFKSQSVGLTLLSNFSTSEYFTCLSQQSRS